MTKDRGFQYSVREYIDLCLHHSINRLHLM